MVPLGSVRTDQKVEWRAFGFNGLVETGRDPGRRGRTTDTRHKTTAMAAKTNMPSATRVRGWRFRNTNTRKARHACARVTRRTDVDLELVMENDQLHSTKEQVWLVAGAVATLTAAFAKGCASASGIDDLLVGCGAAGAGFLAADLLSGIYHWGIDNYGSASTPVFGNQIAGFQGHHRKPWTITKRDFCNNVHGIAAPTMMWAVLLLALPSNCALDVFGSVGGLFVLLSQELHKFAHMKKSELPKSIVLLQDMGLLIGRKAHGQHHTAPFENNYCIVSGVCNSFLDESKIFYKTEKLIFRLTGVEPRCWSEPNDDWREIAHE